MSDLNIQDFVHDDWVKIYDGRWSLLTSTHFMSQYTKELRFGPRPFMSQSVIFISKGRSNGWMRQTDRDVLGSYLSKQILTDPKLVKGISKKLESEAKSVLVFIDENINTVATKELYLEFWRRVLSYYHPHINVKYVADYLDPTLVKKYLPFLQKARLVAEPVFSRSEDFIVAFAKLLSRKTKYKFKNLLCLTKEELLEFFDTEKLPNESELALRDKASALIGNRNGYKCLIGPGVKRIEKTLAPKLTKTEVKGVIAYAGKVRGRVKLVLNPSQVGDFKQGYVLVAGSTRPEFLSMMEKASAFVTDAGGVLSHAAITAREMKKPCVIGTLVATKVFKNGDLVVVDAYKGVVKKI